MIELMNNLKAFVVQAVSRNPSSRADVVQLNDNLDRLLQRHARQGPLCAVREALFSELFGQLGLTRLWTRSSLCCCNLDELIRQITVECPERGLFLMR